MNVIKVVLIALTIMVSISSIALAHKVNLFAYAENCIVYTESYFSDGRKVVNSTIEVFDSTNNKLLLTGKTDDNGEFSFKIPQATGLRIVLTASMGHKNEYLLSEEEVRVAFGKEKPEVETPLEAGEKEKEEVASVSVTKLEDQKLKALVEEAVESKTSAIMKKLTKIEERMQKPSLQEILGGLGYILGLMGIAVYFKYRRKA